MVGKSQTAGLTPHPKHTGGRRQSSPSQWRPALLPTEPGRNTQACSMHTPTHSSDRHPSHQPCVAAPATGCADRSAIRRDPAARDGLPRSARAADRRNHTREFADASDLLCSSQAAEPSASKLPRRSCCRCSPASRRDSARLASVTGQASPSAPTRPSLARMPAGLPSAPKSPAYLFLARGGRV
jgi:hypothetical protein